MTAHPDTPDTPDMRAKAEAAGGGLWTFTIEPTNYPECDDADLPGYVWDAEGKDIAILSERYDHRSEMLNDRQGAHIAAWCPANALAVLDALAAMTKRAEDAERERDEARGIVRDTLWMARRYADGRQSYAVGLYNDATRKALAAGIVKEEGREPVFAHDTMGHRYGDLTAEEHERAKAYRCEVAAAESALTTAQARIRDMETGTAELVEALRPFADEADYHSTHWSRQDKPITPCCEVATNGDLRRAAALVARHTDPGKEVGDAV